VSKNQTLTKSIWNWLHHCNPNHEFRFNTGGHGYGIPGFSPVGCCFVLAWSFRLGRDGKHFDSDWYFGFLGFYHGPRVPLDQGGLSPDLINLQWSSGKLLDLARCRDGRSLNALCLGSFLGHIKGMTRSFAKVL